MNREKSCGAIIFNGEKEKVQYLVIKHKNGGHWDFPKGHVEPGENEQETALREIWEETGLKVNLIEDFRVTTEYSPKENTMKEVVYFLATPIETEIKIQIEEVDAFKWGSYGEIHSLLTYDSAKKLLEKANEFLENK